MQYIKRKHNYLFYVAIFFLALQTLFLFLEYNQWGDRTYGIGSRLIINLILVFWIMISLIFSINDKTKQNNLYKVLIILSTLVFLWSAIESVVDMVYLHRGVNANNLDDLIIMSLGAIYAYYFNEISKILLFGAITAIFYIVLFSGYNHIRNEKRDKIVKIIIIIALVIRIINLFNVYGYEYLSVLSDIIFIIMMGDFLRKVIHVNIHTEIEEYENVNTVDISDQLIKLKNLYDEGVITQEEYDKKRNEKINKL